MPTDNALSVSIPFNRGDRVQIPSLNQTGIVENVWVPTPHELARYPERENRFHYQIRFDDGRRGLFRSSEVLKADAQPSSDQPQ